MIDTRDDEKKTEEEIRDLLYYAGLLALQFSNEISGIDTSAISEEVLIAIRNYAVSYAAAASQAAISTWKVEYLKAIQTAIRDGLDDAELSSMFADITARQIPKLKAMIHDDILDAFRNSMSEQTRLLGITKEKFIAMEDADQYCRPYANQIYNVGEGPQPKIHVRCRCMRIPVSNG